MGHAGVLWCGDGVGHVGGGMGGSCRGEVDDTGCGCVIQQWGGS